MMRRGLVWLPVALVSLLALFYVFNSLRNGNVSTWVLWEKNMTTKDGGETTSREPLDGFDHLSDCQGSGQQILQTALLSRPVRSPFSAAVTVVCQRHNYLNFTANFGDPPTPSDLSRLICVREYSEKPRATSSHRQLRS